MWRLRRDQMNISLTVPELFERLVRRIVLFVNFGGIGVLETDV